MDEKRKYHFDWDETKIEILEFILQNSAHAKEQDISDFMKEKYEGFNRTTTNKHLHQLEKLGCIEKVSPVGKSRHNYWDIPTFKNLKKILSEFPEFKLNIYEKSINIVLHKLGIGRKSSRYVYFFILLRLSTSFFCTCMETDLELLHSRAREIFNHDKGFKNEQRVEKLLEECNDTYIKGKLDFKMSTESFRKIMEDLAKRNDEILEEYAWRICSCYTEQVREKWRSNFTGNDNVIHAIKRNRSQNPSAFALEPVPWIESFYIKFTENIPELYKTDIKTILKTPDEFQDMCLKMEEILSLMRDQNKTFKRVYLYLLFEHFYYQDILDDVASLDEKTFAQNSKKIIEEYSVDEPNDYAAAIEKMDKLIIGEWDNISKVIAKYKIPSILPNISDDSTEVLRELLTLHGYRDRLKYLPEESNVAI